MHKDKLLRFLLDDSDVRNWKLKLKAKSDFTNICIAMNLLTIHQFEETLYCGSIETYVLLVS